MYNPNILCSAVMSKTRLESFCWVSPQIYYVYRFVSKPLLCRLVCLVSRWELIRQLLQCSEALWTKFP